MRPHDREQPGFMMELKSIGADENIEVALQAALKQIKLKNYRAELADQQTRTVCALGIVLQGKNIQVAAE